MTNDEQFKYAQQSMPDDELVDLCDKEISKLCKTGGRSFTMRVPVHVKDTDMLLCELIRRYKIAINHKQKEKKS